MEKIPAYILNLIRNQGFSGGITPTGEIEITENGTYDVSEYANANVNVGSTKTALPNGTKFRTSLVSNFDFLQDMDLSQITDASSMFYQCTNITTIPLLDIKPTSTSNMFYSCSNLTSMPLIDTSRVTACSNMFYSCNKLVTVPQLDFSNTENIGNMFYYCRALSDESLNNIMGMCANMVKITFQDYKKLTYLGITSAQSQVCPTLSNYDAFISAGWTLT